MHRAVTVATHRLHHDRLNIARPILVSSIDINIWYMVQFVPMYEYNISFARIYWWGIRLMAFEFLCIIFVVLVNNTWKERDYERYHKYDNIMIMETDEWKERSKWRNVGLKSKTTAKQNGHFKWSNWMKYDAIHSPKLALYNRIILRNCTKKKEK